MRRTFFAASAAAFLVACLLSGAASRPAFAQTLRIGLREDPDILDPALSGSYVGRIVFAGMCDKLFDYDSKLNLVPQLATGYEYKDPTHLILHLRPGVRFQDGEKLDAAAVKYTLMRDLTLPGSLRKGEINAISAIDVIDPLTVALVLKSPDSPLLSQLADRAGIIVAPEAAKKAGTKFGLHPVCAGPFSFVRRVPEQEIELARFPGYWDAQAIHFNRVVYEPIVNSAVRLANLQAGALDLVEYIAPTDVPAVRKDPKLRLVMDNALGYQGITFNTGHGPMAKSPIGESADLRRAFALAIDRKAVIQVVYNGLFQPIAQAVPPASPFYVPAIQPPPRDIAAAKKLVAASGFKPPIPVTMIVPNSPDLLQAAQVIQAMVQPAGFDLKIQAMEFASSLAAGRAGDFQAYMILWSGRADADGNIYSFLHTGYGFNYGGFSDPVVDRLLDQARLTTNIAKRRAIYGQLWVEEQKKMPILYLWALANIVGMKKTLTGFQQVPDGIIRLQGLEMAKSGGGD
ncbi:MAG TPA: ABC transporter substrate-binding protein [Acetobacteraceae bacterium]|jgi:peptide/nickel transport system substrate-binding protein|nr:ABC transporter substrate-binding protein [Acetobacteraceae bacterium]